jgi:molybdopterin-containing oxidoreductase family iron-sulfur binding subunit
MSRPSAPHEPWTALDEQGLPCAPDASRAEFDSPADPWRVDRREALRLLGASLALAGASGCGDRERATLLSRPVEPEGVSGGRALTYATAVELDGYGRGVFVRVAEGRPVKIEGNPEHPATRGASDPFLQADVLALHDPDRSTAPHRDGQPVEWARVAAWLDEAHADLVRSGGAGTHVLLGATASPTLEGLIARLRELHPRMRFHTYSPVSDPMDPSPEPVHRYDEVDAVFSLGADFLGAGPAQVRHALDWSRRRRDASRSRPWLGVAEPSPTLTGAEADLRLALGPDALEALTYAVASALGIVDAPASEEARRIAFRLQHGRALVVAGRDTSAAVHALVARLNAHLDSPGLRYVAPIRVGARHGFKPVAALLAALAAGDVDRLLVLDANPAYDLPGAAPLLARARDSLHLGLHRDETARHCRWHVPMLHPLERWGDTRAFDGTVGLQQPVATPRQRATSPLELLATLAGERQDARELVRQRWRSLDERAFRAALESGVVPGTAARTVPAPPPAEVPPRSIARSPGGDAPWVLTTPHCARTWDGRYANDAWLQELPQPLTTLVWGNAALLAPATARRLGLRNGDRVAIDRGGVAVECAAWLMPGQAPDVVTLTLGHGRSAAGRIGTGVGADAYPLRAAVGEVRLRALGSQARAIATQSHRPLGPGGPETSGARKAPPAGFHPAPPRGEHAWAMVIDLDACIGCSTCTIACQAENNIPVVGPEEVARGREMHWIRVDRYHVGPPDAPQTTFQPVPCMHCEQAPCEVVCPVGATTHSVEGLNQMVYNRCIGTRTCSNNCPYKVRRFNWYDYGVREPALPAGLRNPRVTVRERGVMEKCTYCVQRIEAARSDARAAGRPLRGDRVVTACQQACPTRAITFGDLRDERGAIAALRRDERHYALLDELNTRPRTTYLARVPRGDPA